jgi:transposase
MGRPKNGINNSYTPEFKLEVVLYNREQGKSQTERVYHIHSSVFYKWDRIYLEEGIEGLSIERRGRSIKPGGKPKGRPVKLSRKVEADLISENQRLRMENDYLKKLAALIQEEEKKQKKSK